jgi:hypothetical protein
MAAKARTNLLWLATDSNEDAAEFRKYVNIFDQEQTNPVIYGDTILVGYNTSEQELLLRDEGGVSKRTTEIPNRTFQWRFLPFDYTLQENVPLTHIPTAKVKDAFWSHTNGLFLLGKMDLDSDSEQSLGTNSSELYGFTRINTDNGAVEDFTTDYSKFTDILGGVPLSNVNGTLTMTTGLMNIYATGVSFNKCAKMTNRTYVLSRPKLPLIASGNPNCSVYAWVYPTSGNTGVYDDGFLKFGLKNGIPVLYAGKNSAAANVQLEIDRWHHFAVCVSSDRMWFYVNGKHVLSSEVRIETISGALDVPARTHVHVGKMEETCGGTSVTTYLNGWISHVAVFNNTLTADWIATHFMFEENYSVNSIAYWPLLENTRDMTGVNNMKEDPPNSVNYDKPPAREMYTRSPFSNSPLGFNQSVQRMQPSDVAEIPCNKISRDCGSGCPRDTQCGNDGYCYESCNARVDRFWCGNPSRNDPLSLRCKSANGIPYIKIFKNSQTIDGVGIVEFEFMFKEKTYYNAWIKMGAPRIKKNVTVYMYRPDSMGSGSPDSVSLNHGGIPVGLLPVFSGHRWFRLGQNIASFYITRPGKWRLVIDASGKETPKHEAADDCSPVPDEDELEKAKIAENGIPNVTEIVVVEAPPLRDDDRVQKALLKTVFPSQRPYAPDVSKAFKQTTCNPVLETTVYNTVLEDPIEDANCAGDPKCKTYTNNSYSRFRPRPCDCSGQTVRITRPVPSSSSTSVCPRVTRTPLSSLKDCAPGWKLSKDAKTCYASVGIPAACCKSKVRVDGIQVCSASKTFLNSNPECAPEMGFAHGGCTVKDIVTAPNTSYYSVNQGVLSRPEKSFQRSNVNTQKECAKICDKDPHCNAFSFTPGMAQKVENYKPATIQAGYTYKEYTQKDMENAINACKNIPNCSGVIRGPTAYDSKTRRYYQPLTLQMGPIGDIVKAPLHAFYPKFFTRNTCSLYRQTDPLDCASCRCTTNCVGVPGRKTCSVSSDCPISVFGNRKLCDTEFFANVPQTNERILTALTANGIAPVVEGKEENAREKYVNAGCASNLRPLKNVASGLSSDLFNQHEILTIFNTTPYGIKVRFFDLNWWTGTPWKNVSDVYPDSFNSITKRVKLPKECGGGTLKYSSKVIRVRCCLKIRLASGGDTERLAVFADKKVSTSGFSELLRKGSDWVKGCFDKKISREWFGVESVIDMVNTSIVSQRVMIINTTTNKLEDEYDVKTVLPEVGRGGLSSITQYSRFVPHVCIGFLDNGKFMYIDSRNLLDGSKARITEPVSMDSFVELKHKLPVRDRDLVALENPGTFGSLLYTRRKGYVKSPVSGYGYMSAFMINGRNKGYIRWNDPISLSEFSSTGPLGKMTPRGGKVVRTNISTLQWVVLPPTGSLPVVPQPPMSINYEKYTQSWKTRCVLRGAVTVKNSTLSCGNINAKIQETVSKNQTVVARKTGDGIEYDVVNKKPEVDSFPSLKDIQDQVKKGEKAQQEQKIITEVRNIRFMREARKMLIRQTNINTRFDIQYPVWRALTVTVPLAFIVAIVAVILLALVK